MKSEESVFLVTEVWLNPDAFEQFKRYRIRVLDMLEQYGMEYIYHGHAFEWVLGSDEGELPTGIEICRFPSEQAVQNALNALEKSDLREEERKIFTRVRCYVSRYALPSHLTYSAPTG